MRRQQVALIEVSNRYPDVLDMLACKDLSKEWNQRVIVMKARWTPNPLILTNEMAAGVGQLHPCTGSESTLRGENQSGVRHFRGCIPHIGALCGAASPGDSRRGGVLCASSVSGQVCDRASNAYVSELTCHPLVEGGVCDFPGRFFMSKTQIATFFHCARFLASQQTNKEVVFFLATDQNAVRFHAKKHLPEGQVYWVTGNVTRATNDGIKRAMADMLLLEEAHDLITTAGSSFGRLAVARKGVPPYVVTKAASCVRQLTSEPCSRLWWRTRNMTCLDGVPRDPRMVNHEDCDETW